MTAGVNGIIPWQNYLILKDLCLVCLIKEVLCIDSSKKLGYIEVNQNKLVNWLKETGKAIALLRF